MERKAPDYGIELVFKGIVEGQNRAETFTIEEFVVAETPAGIANALKLIEAGETKLPKGPFELERARLVGIEVHASGKKAFSIEAFRGTVGVDIHWDRLHCFQVGEKLLKAVIEQYPEQARALKSKAVEVDMGM